MCRSTWRYCSLYVSDTDREKKRKYQRFLRIKRVLDRKITSLGTVLIGSAMKAVTDVGSRQQRVSKWKILN
jgi:hypothetical protein